MKINYIFFGSPEFAEIVLKKLIETGLPPLAVVTNPDRPVGRKKKLTSPQVKVLAEKHGIKVFQPERITDEFISEIAELKPEFFVIAAYAKIIPLKLIAVPPLGSLGIHPSLLPLYRGASPIQGVILGGEKETGVAIYMMDEKVDHGGILAKSKLKMVNNETYKTLLKKLAKLGGELLVETLPKFLKGEIKPEPQNEAMATLTKKYKTEDGFVDEKELNEAESGNYELATTIDCKIRALNPEPGVWTLRQAPASIKISAGGQGKQKRMKLLEAEIKDGRLILKTIQIEGKTPQPAKVLF